VAVTEPLEVLNPALGILAVLGLAQGRGVRPGVHREVFEPEREVRGRGRGRGRDGRRRLRAGNRRRGRRLSRGLARGDVHRRAVGSWAMRRVSAARWKCERAVGESQPASRWRRRQAGSVVGRRQSRPHAGRPQRLRHAGPSLPHRSCRQLPLTSSPTLDSVIPGACLVQQPESHPIQISTRSQLLALVIPAAAAAAAAASVAVVALLLPLLPPLPRSTA
jgi:hypothetical protein